MTPRFDLTPGNIRHAPGVVCFVAAPPSGKEEQVNNGRFVVIQYKLSYGSLYQCGCQSTVMKIGYDVAFPASDILWDCAGNNIVCINARYIFGRWVPMGERPTPHRVFPQSWLIPVANGSNWKELVESEATDEEIEQLHAYVEGLNLKNL